MSPQLTRYPLMRKDYNARLQSAATFLALSFRRNGGICLKHRDDRPYYVSLTTLVRFLELYDVIIW